jgi:hypothetical protein
LLALNSSLISLSLIIQGTISLIFTLLHSANASTIREGSISLGESKDNILQIGFNSQKVSVLKTEIEVFSA